MANSNFSFSQFFSPLQPTLLNKDLKVFAWWWNKAAVGAEQNQLGLVVNAGLHGDPKNFSTFFLAIKCFMISTGTWRTCLPFSSTSRYHNSWIDYLDGWQPKRWNLSKGKERMFASALPLEQLLQQKITFTFHFIRFPIFIPTLLLLLSDWKCWARYEEKHVASLTCVRKSGAHAHMHLFSVNSILCQLIDIQQHTDIFVRI